MRARPLADVEPLPRMRPRMLAVPTAQSLGGEDFSWYLSRVPGAMARLGTRTPGGRTYDLHQGDLIVDEQSLGNAVSLLTGVVFAGQVKPGDD